MMLLEILFSSVADIFSDVVKVVVGVCDVFEMFGACIIVAACVTGACVSVDWVNGAWVTADWVTGNFVNSVAYKNLC